MNGLESRLTPHLIELIGSAENKVKGPLTMEALKRFRKDIWVSDTLYSILSVNLILGDLLQPTPLFTTDDGHSIPPAHGVLPNEEMEQMLAKLGKDMFMGRQVLKRVEQLWIKSAKLTRLSAAVGGLSLVSLRLDDNLLRSLPGEIRNLQGLRELRLGNNQFDVFPKVLCDLPQLQTLDLSWNRLKMIPKTIEKLTNLESLLLTHNLIEALPETLGSMHFLKCLQVDWNKLEELPETLGNMGSLTWLNVSANQLKKLPNLRALTSLRWLNITENPSLRPREKISDKILRYLPLTGSQPKIDDPVLSKVNRDVRVVEHLTDEDDCNRW